MHSHLFADDEAIGYQFTDCLTRVSVRDFIDFIRVEPDFTLAATHDGGCKPFLGAKIDPNLEKEE